MPHASKGELERERETGKETQHYPISGHSRTSLLWDWEKIHRPPSPGMDLRRGTVKQVFIACPSLVLRGRNETADLVVCSSQLCDLQIACLKSSFPCIFFFLFSKTHFQSFCFSFGRSHECDRKNLSSEHLPFRPSFSPLFFNLHGHVNRLIRLLRGQPACALPSPPNSLAPDAGR